MDHHRLTRAVLPVAALAAFVAFPGLAALAADQAGALAYDFRAYDAAVDRLLAGRPLYDTEVEFFGPSGAFFYPPPFILIALPMALLDPTIGAWAWTLALAGAFAVGVALLPVPARIRWLILLLGGLSWPLVYSIKLGQVGAILFLTLAAGWRWMDRPLQLGAAAAIGTAIKIQPAILFGWALLTGRRRAVAVGFGVLALLALGATLVAGPSAWIDQATILARVSKPIDTPHNFTPGRLALEAGLPHVIAWAIQVANWGLVAVVALWATLRATAAASYLAVVVASQLMSPILWDHYALLLLLPVAWLISRGHTWAVLISLATAAPLALVIPPVAYPLAHWVTLVAVARVGFLDRAAELRA